MGGAVGQIELSKATDPQQYELRVDGRLVSLATYHERDDVVTIPHTQTAPAFGGRGYAGKLVRFALDDIRAQHRTVDPACPFVADYIGQHPEYADLLTQR